MHKPSLERKISFEKKNIKTTEEISSPVCFAIATARVFPAESTVGKVRDVVLAFFAYSRPMWQYHGISLIPKVSGVKIVSFGDIHWSGAVEITQFLRNKNASRLGGFYNALIILGCSVIIAYKDFQSGPSTKRAHQACSTTSSEIILYWTNADRQILEYVISYTAMGIE